MNFTLLKGLVKQEEGYRKSAYHDTEGWLTIGHGFLIDPRKNAGLSPYECDLILEHRLEGLVGELSRRVDGWEGFPEAVQRALVSMSFQMGVSGLLRFKKTLKHLRAGEYLLAAEEALDSEWARQTPARAKRVAEVFRQAAWDRGVRGGG